MISVIKVGDDGEFYISFSCLNGNLIGCLFEFVVLELKEKVLFFREVLYFIRWCSVFIKVGFILFFIFNVYLVNF